MKPKLILLIVTLALAVSAGAQGRFASEIAAFRARDTVEGVRAGGILFVGSSTFRAWEDLERRFAGYDVLNRGFGGSRLSDVIYYFDEVVRPYSPRQIVLYEGDNDLTASVYSADDFIRDLEIFIHMVELHLPGTRICLVSIKPSPIRQSLASKYTLANARMRWMCYENPQLLTYIDTRNPMLGRDGLPAAKYFLSDGLHLNRRGYDLWTGIIRPYLIK